MGIDFGQPAEPLSRPYCCGPRLNNINGCFLRLEWSKNPTAIDQDDEFRPQRSSRMAVEPTPDCNRNPRLCFCPAER